MNQIIKYTRRGLAFVLLVLAAVFLILVWLIDHDTVEEFFS